MIVPRAEKFTSLHMNEGFDLIWTGLHNIYNRCIDTTTTDMVAGWSAGIRMMICCFVVLLQTSE